MDRAETIRLQRLNAGGAGVSLRSMATGGDVVGYDDDDGGGEGMDLEFGPFSILFLALVVVAMGAVAALVFFNFNSPDCMKNIGLDAASLKGSFKTTLSSSSSTTTTAAAEILDKGRKLLRKL